MSERASAPPALPAWLAHLLAATRILPPALAWRLGAQLGWWFGHLPLRDVRRARAQLARAFPTATPAWVHRTAAGCFRHFGRMALWSIATSQIAPARLLARIAVEGPENLAALRQACRRGEGTVGFVGHFGNWELMARIGNLVAPTTIVGRRLRHPLADLVVNGLRRSSGSDLVYQDDDARVLARRLRAGRFVAILADQDIPRLPGVHVPWFGIPAYTPSAPAGLALLAQAAVMPVFLYARAGRWVLHFGPRLPTRRDGDRAQAIARITAWAMRYEEGLVRRHPSQWVWWHLRWRTPPPATAAASHAPSAS